ncbi:MAG: regulator [Bacteroidetes bacterium]|nr:MAG: regulator [Bacteroidota bacterium]
MEGYSIFIVEDDPWFGEILEYHLALNPDYQIRRFTNAKDCLDNLHQKPNLVTIDYSLPDMNGVQLLKKIKEYNNEIPVIAISGQEDVGTAVELLKMGLQDYIVKDENSKDLLWNAVVKARETHKLKNEIEQLRNELEQKFDFEKSIKGNSPALKRIFALMEKATKTNINVSITGETGTGKEVVAKAIHYNSDRKKKSFVAVNMAAIPRELLESELFGHEKGAFTGAIARKIGKFEEADKGSLFLDEIAELDLSLQSKLLRVLQERELTRIGGNEKVKLDVRLIVASHKNLLDEVKAGRFREDLYYRIFGLPIELPALRERGNDILLLAKHFTEEFCRENKMPPIQISPEGRDKLMHYKYPGNVRELKAIIELAVVMSDGKEIKPDDITYTATNGDTSFLHMEMSLRDYTCNIIKHYLKKYDNDVLLVADKLDIGKSTIYKMIQAKEIVI